MRILFSYPFSYLLPFPMKLWVHMLILSIILTAGYMINFLLQGLQDCLGGSSPYREWFENNWLPVSLKCQIRNGFKLIPKGLRS